MALAELGWTPKASCEGAAGLTTMPDWAPVMVAFTVSVARMYWVPLVFKVAVN